MIDHTDVVYAPKKKNLAWPIILGAICDRNQIEKIT